MNETTDVRNVVREKYGAIAEGRRGLSLRFLNRRT